MSRILAIDDDKQILSIIKRALAKDMHTVDMNIMDWECILPIK